MADFQTLQDSSSVLFKILRNGITNEKSSELLQFFIYKGIVTDIDEVGKVFDGINPPRSLKVKVFYPIQLSEEKIVYPDSDYIKQPVSVGEIVRFVFDDETLTKGYWISRISMGEYEKKLATEYLTKKTFRNDQSAKAFEGAFVEEDEKVTESGILNETPSYDPLDKEILGSEDGKLYGRKDGIVLKPDGTFEIGEGATTSAVLGELLLNYLSDGVQGKLMTIQDCFTILLPIITLILEIAALIALMQGGAAVTPIIAAINQKIEELNQKIPLIGEKGNYLSKIVKLK